MNSDNNPWRHSIVLFLIITLGSGLIGFLFNHTSWGFCLGLLGYILWLSRQLYRFQQWLKNTTLLSEPPESSGLWGHIFDRIYTLQKQEKAARKMLHGVIKRAQDSTNTLTDGVVITNAQGLLEWWNRSASQLLNFRYPQDRGLPISHLIRDPVFKRYFEEKDYKEPLTLMLHHGHPIEFHMTLFGKNERLLLARDVSRLQQLEKVRTEFVANASHELRTPLTVLKGYLDTFLPLSDSFNPAFKRGLSQMQDQIQRMEALITDLLLLSKLENSMPIKESSSVPLHALLSRVIAEAQTVYANKPQQIELIADRIMLLGHPEELHSAFSNIILNAVKYTQENGHIRVEALQHEQEVWIEVIDDGPGIDPSHINRLTERFFRGDQSRAQQIPGTGLGLAIVKHVLIRHDAKLEIISKPGEGSCFRCRFPKHRYQVES